MRHQEIICDAVDEAAVAKVSNPLPMDKASRMARARSLGFTIPAYHGTGSKFTAFNLEKGRARNHGFGYAPHFASRKAEASGYAGKGHVLSVLLRLRKPFLVNHEMRISPEFFHELTGETWDDYRQHYAVPSIHSPPTSYNVMERIKERYKEGWDNPRRMWTNVYQHLMQHGYDALVDPQCPADHSPGYYAKYVVFDPKDIRLVTARFDPADAESADLKA